MNGLNIDGLKAADVDISQDLGAGLEVPRHSGVVPETKSRSGATHMLKTLEEVVGCVGYLDLLEGVQRGHMLEHVVR